jgi:hypothetical protein
LVAGDAIIRDGAITLPNEPGLGLTLNEDEDVAWRVCAAGQHVLLLNLSATREEEDQ